MTRLVVLGVDPADQRTSWEVLRARLAAYYRERDEAEKRAQVAVVTCSYCRKGWHKGCHGRSLYGTVPCSCTDGRHAALNAAGGA